MYCKRAKPERNVYIAAIFFSRKKVLDLILHHVEFDATWQM
jgi:hypothetical protein